MTAIPDNTSSITSPLSEQFIYCLCNDKPHCQEMAQQLPHFGYTLMAFSTIESLEAAILNKPPAALIYEQASDPSSTSTLINISKSAAKLPLIIIANEGHFAMRLKAVRTGCSAFFTYPVDVIALVEALDSLSPSDDIPPARILIVEDTRTQANLYSLVLDRSGMQTRVLIEPADILTPLADFNPDLILMDMYMPGCSGMELARIIRQIDRYVSLPIVYLSAETDRDKQIAAIAFGDDFLTKPIRPDHLVASVNARVERYRKLRSLMVTDSLTGLLNHVALKEALAREVLIASRQNTPITYCMIDLDQFKQVNDTHGHPAGDRVLKGLARLFRQRLRRSDIVGRYGGEEFAIIFPNTEVEDAFPVVDELRQDFAETHFHTETQSFSVTFSAGLANFPQFTDPSDLRTAADQALYFAKRRGCNQVRIRKP